MAPTQLQIKTKAYERLVKERSLYIKDVEEQKKSLEEKRDYGSDVYETKKLSQVLEESQRLVAELDKKILEHKQRLADFLQNYEGDEDVEPAQLLINNSPLGQ